MMLPHDDFKRNFFVAAVAGIPYVGGSLSFLLDQYLPSECEKRRNDFLKQLSEDIENLKEKINLSNMETPEFQAIFERLLRATVEEHRKEKLISFRNITLNMLDGTTPNFDKADFFSRLVLSMIPDEIKILHVFYALDVKRTLTASKEYDNKQSRDIYGILGELWGAYDKEYVKALIVDCMRYSLISASRAQKAYEKRDGIFLTTLGIEFLTYIFEPVGDDVLTYGKA